MSENPKTIISLIGRTGDGKSSFGNLLLREFGYVEQNCFGEGPGFNSHTHVPKSETVGNFIVVDNPGLVDTDGPDKDIENLTKIVDRARKLGYVSVFALIVNSRAPKFDHAMQAAVKLIADSFGPNCLNQLCFVYTRCPNLNGDRKKEIPESAASFTSVIKQKCTFENIGFRPFYYVDCHPDRLKDDGAPDDVIQEFKKGIHEQVKAFVNYASSQKPYSTENAHIEHYDFQKAAQKAKEEQEKYAQEIQNLKNVMTSEKAKHDEYTQTLKLELEKQSAQREFNGKVVGKTSQEQRIIKSTTTNPIHEKVMVPYERLRHSPLGWLFRATKTDYRPETHHTGNLVEHVYEVQKRDIHILGNGEIKEGSWYTDHIEIETTDTRTGNTKMEKK